jgi:putative acetyltransferase
MIGAFRSAFGWGRLKISVTLSPALPMQLHIRPVTDLDLPDLIAIQTLSIETYYRDVHSPDQVRALAKMQLAGIKPKRQLLLVAEVDGETVGFAGISRLGFAIDAVYIHPQWMRQGIGRQLVSALEVLALQQGYSRLIVLADVVTSPFYQSQGYQVCTTTQYWLEDNVDPLPCHYLNKQLRPETPMAVWQKYLWGGLGLLLIMVGIGAYQQSRSNSATTIPTGELWRSD